MIMAEPQFTIVFYDPKAEEQYLQKRGYKQIDFLCLDARTDEKASINALQFLSAAAANEPGAWLPPLVAILLPERPQPVGEAFSSYGAICVTYPADAKTEKIKDDLARMLMKHFSNPPEAPAPVGPSQQLSIIESIFSPETLSPESRNVLMNRIRQGDATKDD